MGFFPFDSPSTLLGVAQGQNDLIVSITIVNDPSSVNRKSSPPKDVAQKHDIENCYNDSDNPVQRRIQA